MRREGNLSPTEEFGHYMFGGGGWPHPNGELISATPPRTQTPIEICSPTEEYDNNTIAATTTETTIKEGQDITFDDHNNSTTINHITTITIYKRHHSTTTITEYSDTTIKVTNDVTTTTKTKATTTFTTTSSSTTTSYNCATNTIRPTAEQVD
jgi:hypothetical protein